ncbi:MAG: RNA polymerase sigma factor [Candidatus Omnitrophica bacterium]|nr:RNA polymerase sigma factor [Candidatus Omnitrophota bacterium]MCK5288356.1 RNA polymerase sigma factor [Candidatus Omnitrophota bacterium]
MQDIPREALKRASEGNIDDFEVIYKATSGFVYSVALGITKNRSSAEDVVQEVFLKIYKSLNNFQFRSTFKTWVYRITINTAINKYKNKLKYGSLKNKYEQEVRYDYFYNQSESLIDKQDNKKFLAVLLDKLNVNQKTCIILREIEGLTYKEISEVLNVKVNTVRTRLKRARETLMAGKIKEVIKNEL